MELSSMQPFQPPLEPIGRLEQLQIQVEKFAARHAAVAAVAGVVFWVVSFCVILLPAPTTLSAIGIGIASIAVTSFSQELVKTAFKMAKAGWWERYFLPYKKELPTPENFKNCLYSERTITLEEKKVAALRYEEENSLPVLEINSENYEDDGLYIGMLLAPQIHYLYHAVYLPLIKKDPTLLQRAEKWALPEWYSRELRGIAEGLTEYTKITAFPLKEIDFTALKATNFAMEELRRSGTAMVDGTLEHLEHTPSKGLLSRYAIKRRTRYTNHATGEQRQVEWVTYPGLIGCSFASNDKGLVATVSPNKHLLKEGQGAPASMIPRYLAEVCNSVEEAKTELNRDITSPADRVALADKHQAVSALLGKTITYKPISTIQPKGEQDTTLAVRIVPGEKPVWYRDYYAAHRKLSAI